jgi:hypothetical protein
MKHNKLYLIKTLSIKKGVNLTDDLQEMILTKISNVLDENDDKEMVIESFDDREFMFFRLSYMKVMRICSILEPFINYSVDEISDKVILGDVDEYDFIIDNDDLSKFFNSFRLDNACVDDILDKILEKGISSLDEVDKLILVK